MPPRRTDVDLVVELGRLPPSPARARLLWNAARGEYHDAYGSDPGAKLVLVQDLRASGFAALAGRVAAGDFDEGERAPRGDRRPDPLLTLAQALRCEPGQVRARLDAERGPEGTD